MLKSAILLFNTIALLMYELFFAGDITVTQKVPATAKTDTEFTVELTVNKGSTTGFAKLQQELPNGFTAVEDKNGGGSFTFSNQTVKFIWMSLPNDAEFKVTYKVKIAEGISGDQSIGGKFSYVVDNEKKSYDIAPATITVEGDGATASNNTTTPDNTTTTPDNTTTTPDNTTTTPDNTTANTTQSNGDGSFSCVRSVPADGDMEFVVTLNVSKGNLGGFAKLVETLPDDFTASSLENAGGSFSFADGKARFIWVSLPTQPEFKVSYTVRAPKNAGSKTIEGQFSYIENDETRKYTVAPTTVNIGSGIGTVAAQRDPEPNNTSDPNVLSLSPTNIPTPQNGVTYQVQIMALQNNRAASTVSSYYGIGNVVKTQHEGLNKYLLKATHTEYKAARDAREGVRGTVVSVNTQRGQPSAPPFVVAFNSGRRITVQDALMATSQKWYR